MKHCVVLCIYSGRQVNTDIDMQKQTSFILPIKRFLIIEQDFQALNNAPLRVQNHIHDINMHDSDSITSCSNPNTSVVNTMKKLYLGGPLWYELKSE